MFPEDKGTAQHIQCHWDSRSLQDRHRRLEAQPAQKWRCSSGLQDTSCSTTFHQRPARKRLTRIHCMSIGKLFVFLALRVVVSGYEPGRFQMDKPRTQRHPPRRNVLQGTGIEPVCLLFVLLDNKSQVDKVLQAQAGLRGRSNSL